MSITINELAIKRTRLANQRTYLAYMRTGFMIASIAGIFKKIWVALFGLIMIILSTTQYIIININLSNKKKDNKILHMIPIIYIILFIGLLYLQIYHSNK